MNGETSPIHPEVYLKQVKSFAGQHDSNHPVTKEDINKYLVDVIGQMARQTGHGYLKMESDARPESSSNKRKHASSLKKWGLFGVAVVGLSYLLIKGSSKSCDDISP